MVTSLAHLNNAILTPGDRGIINGHQAVTLENLLGWAWVRRGAAGSPCGWWPWLGSALLGGDIEL